MYYFLLSLLLLDAILLMVVVLLQAGKGGELTVPAGHVWMELVPAVNGNVTFAK